MQGIVLAGGKSSRFGEDKALALVEGVSMIERAVNLLAEFDLEPCVITHESRDYSFLNCRIENDLISEKGPLGGVYTACKLFPETALLMVTCDMPRLDHRTLKSLTSAYQGAQITVFQRAPGFFQPFPGIYQSSLAAQAGDALDAGELSLQSFIQRIPEPEINMLRCPAGSDLSLVNINSKEDLYGLRLP